MENSKISKNMKKSENMQILDGEISARKKAGLNNNVLIW